MPLFSDPSVIRRQAKGYDLADFAAPFTRFLKPTP